MADIERRYCASNCASVAPMRAVATGGDGARGAMSGATMGDEREPDLFDMVRRDAENEPDFYVQNRGVASHLSGLLRTYVR